jgi:hypothetical protein
MEFAFRDGGKKGETGFVKIISLGGKILEYPKYGRRMLLPRQNYVKYVQNFVKSATGCVKVCNW